MTLVRELRRRVPAAQGERCELCGGALAARHRHLIQLEQRVILCSCESCWALRSGDPELRPVGTRTIWLESFRLPDELWSAFRIPIGLAFLFASSATGRVTALYPSPAGATESELDLDAWGELVRLNPLLLDLEPDAEALLVNRTVEPPQHAIAPIDRCYELVGLVRTTWRGISGGEETPRAVAGFFDELRKAAR